MIQAESTATAKLFTTTLHQNSLTFDTQSSIESFPLASISLATESPGQIDLYRSRLPGESGKSAFQTVVANLGPYVVQINGTASREEQFSDFARQVLYKLQTEAQTQPNT